jgi:hypothetical protein
MTLKLLEHHDDDGCAMPPGVTDTSVALRSMACHDVEHGRISMADYRKLVGVDQPPAPATHNVQWAATVRAFSSQWSDGQWSAQQVLGPPNVYPLQGDQPAAWASKEADAGPEFIEVGFAQPQRLRAMEIYESFNPGAVRSIELIGQSGAHKFVGVGGLARQVDFTCTDEPIVAARITLASQDVAGWNEIDAIGAVACQ